MSRLAELFARTGAEDRPAMIAFVPGGWPEPHSTPELVQALVESGADAVEIGIPFSDPLADGPTNQAAYQQALDHGVTPGDVLDAVRACRSAGISAPLLLMGYFNPLLAMGIDAFAEAAERAGADGLIIVDLPVEEAAELAGPARAHGLDIIYLLAPTSTNERIAAVAERGEGFIYCVSVTGVTSARARVSAELPDFVARVRERTDLPLAVGFGISRREHVVETGRVADGVVVGSALVDAIGAAPPEGRAQAARTLMETLTGRTESGS